MSDLHTAFGHRPIYICGEAATRALKFESRKNNLPFMKILIG